MPIAEIGGSESPVEEGRHAHQLPPEESNDPSIEYPSAVEPQHFSGRRLYQRMFSVRRLERM